MTCRELVELVTDYLEDRLEEADRRRFDEHLGECPDCREYVEQMRHTVRALGTVSEDTLSAPARDALLHAFESWRA